MEQFIQAFVLAVMIGFLYTAIAAGLSLEFGVSRLVNFAHGEFVTLGAYITYFIANDRAPWMQLVGLAVAGVAVAGLSALTFRGFLGRVLRSNQEVNQLLATLGLSIVLQGAISETWSPDVRSINTKSLIPTVRMSGVVIPGPNLLVALVSLLMFVLLLTFMKMSTTGLRMRLAADNLELAAFTGINVERMAEYSFIIGGGTAGVAGGLVALILYVSPLVGFGLVGIAFAIVALGGLGNVPGSLLGAMVVALAIGMTNTYVSQGATYSEGVAFVLLVIGLILRASGLSIGMIGTSRRRTGALK